MRGIGRTKWDFFTQHIITLWNTPPQDVAHKREVDLPMEEIYRWLLARMATWNLQLQTQSIASGRNSKREAVCGPPSGVRWVTVGNRMLDEIGLQSAGISICLSSLASKRKAWYTSPMLFHATSLCKKTTLGDSFLFGVSVSRRKRAPV